MFAFLSKLKSHQKVEQKYDRIIDKGFVNKDRESYSTEFGEYYDKDGSIRIDGFVNEATNYLTSNIFDMEHKQSIEKYRYMSTMPEVDDAIEEITNSAIVIDQDVDSIVKIDFTDDDLSDNLKKIITEEFEYIRDELLDFRTNAHKIFRQWYIDGCLYIEKVIDGDNVRDGILKLNVLDSYFVSYFKVFDKLMVKTHPHMNSVMEYFFKSKVKDEFFVVKKPNYLSSYFNTFNNNSMFTQQRPYTYMDTMYQIKVPKVLIAYVDSGLYHPKKYYPYSYLHKALKITNQLNLLEDALLIYRITRAPERRIFYIEVGNMPPNKAEEYIRKLMRQYRQEKIYDVNTGSIQEKGMFMAMTEDFWLPRRNGTLSTEVGTLVGGQNLAEIDDLNYFARKIWRALSVPYSRRADRENQGVTFNSGRELTLEELKFYKFIMKLRNQFSKIFEDLLATQLIAKRIINSEELNVVLSKIKYIFHNDNYFSQYLKLDIINSKMEVLNNVDAQVGKYFDKKFVWEEVWGFTFDEWQEMDKRIKESIKLGEIQPSSGAGGPGMGGMSGLGGMGGIGGLGGPETMGGPGGTPQPGGGPETMGGPGGTPQPGGGPETTGGPGGAPTPGGTPELI